MSPVIPLRRCRVCGQPARPRELALRDQVLARGVLVCDGCVERADLEIASVYPINRALRDAGVPDDVRNDVMGFLLTRLRAAGALPLRAPEPVDPPFGPVDGAP